MRVRLFLFMLPILLLSALLVTQFADAQPPLGTCAALIEVALQDMGGNCGALGTNQACYGYNRVDATFYETVAADFFSAPADREHLSAFDTIHTAPLDIPAQQWGIAVLSAQANLQGTLPGQNVTFVLIGDAEVENEVAPASGRPLVTLITQSETQLRSGPGLNTNFVGTIPGGTVIDAFGVSQDGGWLRVQYQQTSGWILQSTVNQSNSLERLATIFEEARTPMQAFQFRTGVGEPTCTQSPNVIGIRGPENITVNLTANGADIEIGSIIAMQDIGSNRVNFIIQQGHLDTTDGRRAVGGQTLIGEMDENRHIRRWENPRLQTDAEQDIGEFVQMVFERLGYPYVPSPLPLPVPVVTEEAPISYPVRTCGPNVVHIVQRGDTVFGIAMQYGTTIDAMVYYNDIADANEIFVGQHFVIPCRTGNEPRYIPRPRRTPTPVVTEEAPLTDYVPPVCGNQICEVGENANSCSADCALRGA